MAWRRVPREGRSKRVESQMCRPTHARGSNSTGGWKKGWGRGLYGLGTVDKPAPFETEESTIKEQLLGAFEPQEFLKSETSESPLALSPYMQEGSRNPNIFYRRIDADTFLAAVAYGRLIVTGRAGDKDFLVGIILAKKEGPSKWVYHDHVILSSEEWDNLLSTGADGEAFWALSELEAEFYANKQRDEVTEINGGTDSTEDSGIANGGLGGSHVVTPVVPDTEQGAEVLDLHHPVAVRTSPKVSHSLLSLDKGSGDEDAYWRAYDTVGTKGATPNPGTPNATSAAGHNIAYGYPSGLTGEGANDVSTGLAPDVSTEDLWRSSDVGWQDQTGDNADARDEDDYWASYG
ncbi:hypothetical protein HDU93_005166 [Gonapodya sp. JEL0774]|nr:hypothetical protein HDU93_005166 [Gonapodya sp. JEL0774]